MNAMAMMVFGVCVGIASALLPSYLDKRTTKRRIVIAGLISYIASFLAFISVPTGLLAFLPILGVSLAFAVGYPALLAIYSLSVDETEQGWIMGVTAALFTAGAGFTSLIGGAAMSIAPQLPFIYGAAVAGLAIILVYATWSYPAVRKVVDARYRGSDPSSKT